MVFDTAYCEARTAYGVFEPETNTIIIRSGLKYEQLLDTLIHEALHAAEAVYDINFEHSALHTLAVALAQMLKPLMNQEAINALALQ